ncbi:integral membrane protein GPR180-like isoform X1 [Xiphophorus hellerii]|uniref:integral membrane protein GPR180-like isoform X1 n=1 Tax=Xiphophorus hellerii TaxID=8084 RepID=UPI0013B45D46|nr:integral membrane protein GPR180-like isoform X1 [Xiphophorus hellerii]
MWRLSATLVVALLLSLKASGKSVRGVFRSEAARQENGQFITKFMYQAGDGGLLVCRLDNPSLGTEKEARLLLYQDMDSDLDNLSCSQRLSRAQFTISLSQDEHNQTIPRQSSPTAWQVLYADRYTCEENSATPSFADLGFTLLLFNPDSAGNPLDHFSAEEAGLHSFYFLLLLAYFIACCIYFQPLYQALKKGGPMHTVLKVLTMALALQGCSALCNYIHLARYSRDGTGIPLMGSLAEFWDMVSQVSMLYMLLSLCMGWTLSRGRKPQSRPLQWERSPASTAVAVGGVVTQGVLLLWEQYSESESEHHSYHAQRSLAGLLLLALRVALSLLLASVLYQIVSTERSTLKRDFYLCFAKGCFLWFLCHPVLVLMSVVFNDHQREKVITIGVILCQSISMVILYQLFLSRSLYWEVSSLSSVSLPLTMSRTNHRGRL